LTTVIVTKIHHKLVPNE